MNKLISPMDQITKCEKILKSFQRQAIEVKSYWSLVGKDFILKHKYKGNDNQAKQKCLYKVGNFWAKTSQAKWKSNVL